MTNGWEELLRRTVTLPKRLLIVQTNVLRDLRPELMTFGLQGSVPGRDHGNCKRKNLGLPVSSMEVPETTLMHTSVTYKQTVSLVTTDKEQKTNGTLPRIFFNKQTRILNQVFPCRSYAIVPTEQGYIGPNLSSFRCCLQTMQ